MTSHVRLIIAEVEAAPGELGQLVQQIAAALPVRPMRALPPAGVEAETRPRALLNEQTAVCERCGCTWNSPCPDGCGWNAEAWAAGHAVCTSCQPDVLDEIDRAVDPPPPAPRRRASRHRATIAPARKPKAARSATTRRCSRLKLTEAEWADIGRRLAAGEGATAVARLRVYRGRITNSGIRLRATREGWARPTRGTNGRKRATSLPSAPAPGDGKPAFRCASCGQRTHTNPCEHCFERF